MASPSSTSAHHRVRGLLGRPRQAREGSTSGCTGGRSRGAAPAHRHGLALPRPRRRAARISSSELWRIPSCSTRCLFSLSDRTSSSVDLYCASSAAMRACSSAALRCASPRPPAGAPRAPANELFLVEGAQQLQVAEVPLVGPAVGFDAGPEVAHQEAPALARRVPAGARDLQHGLVSERGRPQERAVVRAVLRQQVHGVLDGQTHGPPKGAGAERAGWRAGGRARGLWGATCRAGGARRRIGGMLVVELRARLLTLRLRRRRRPTRRRKRFCGGRTTAGRSTSASVRPCSGSTTPSTPAGTATSGPASRAGCISNVTRSPFWRTVRSPPTAATGCSRSAPRPRGAGVAAAAKQAPARARGGAAAPARASLACPDCKTSDPRDFEVGQHGDALVSSAARWSPAARAWRRTASRRASRGRHDARGPAARAADPFAQAVGTAEETRRERERQQRVTGFVSRRTKRGFGWCVEHRTPGGQGGAPDKRDDGAGEQSRYDRRAARWRAPSAGWSRWGRTSRPSRGARCVVWCNALAHHRCCRLGDGCHRQPRRCRQACSRRRCSRARCFLAHQGDDNIDAQAVQYANERFAQVFAQANANQRVNRSRVDALMRQAAPEEPCTAPSSPSACSEGSSCNSARGPAPARCNCGACSRTASCSTCATPSRCGTVRCPRARSPCAAPPSRRCRTPFRAALAAARPTARSRASVDGGVLILAAVELSAGAAPGGKNAGQAVGAAGPRPKDGRGAAHAARKSAAAARVGR